MPGKFHPHDFLKTPMYLAMCIGELHDRKMESGSVVFALFVASDATECRSALDLSRQAPDEQKCRKYQECDAYH